MVSGESSLDRGRLAGVREAGSKLDDLREITDKYDSINFVDVEGLLGEEFSFRPQVDTERVNNLLESIEEMGISGSLINIPEISPQEIIGTLKERQEDGEIDLEGDVLYEGHEYNTESSSSYREELENYNFFGENTDPGLIFISSQTVSEITGEDLSGEFQEQTQRMEIISGDVKNGEEDLRGLNLERPELSDLMIYLYSKQLKGEVNPFAEKMIWSSTESELLEDKKGSIVAPSSDMLVRAGKIDEDGLYIKEQGVNKDITTESLVSVKFS